jgi:hypothetical protein
MDETFDAMFRALLDCLPAEWLAAEMHVTRVPKAGGGDTLRVAINHPKGTRGECGPSEKLVRHLSWFVATGPADWTSYHLKAKRKRQGGWDVDGKFKADEAEREAAARAGDGNDWVANSRQTVFGARFLGTYSRLCVRKKRKAGWVLEESRWFLFIPLGTRTTKLAGCDRIYTFWDVASSKHVIELEATGRPSERLYEGHSQARRDWLVQTLQDLLCVPVEQTRVITIRG